NVGIPPTTVSQIRRVDPRTGNAEIWALGVRNSVGCDVDPRTGKYWFTENARDWISDDLPSLPREAPRLCRGGSRSLTFPAVAHRRNADLSHHAQEKSFRDGPVLMGLPTSE